MDDPLLGRFRIVALAGPLFEDLELYYPKVRLEEEGAEVVVAGFDDSVYGGSFWSLALASRGRGHIPGLDGVVYTGIHGMPIAVDATVSSLDPRTTDAVVIPGGYSADHQRRSPEVLDFCRAVAERGHPVAAICHGPWVLASAGLVEGRQVTGHWVIRPDVEGAGASWVDKPCVIDGPIITSRFPHDLGPFCRAIIEACLAARGRNDSQGSA